MFILSADRSQQIDIQSPFAAIDLGSNSFHMIIALWRNEHWQIIDRLRDPVRLLAGLEQHCLSDAVQQRALECLSRFRQRLASIPSANIRAVGTKTLRSACNAQAFIQQATDCLGHEIEVISGEEEARLIYLGVAHEQTQDPQPRLVIDIGGGSTEVILGSGFEPCLLESLNMGCVNIRQRFFADGQVDAARVQAAILHCAQEIEPIQYPLLQQGWVRVIGASGSIKSAAEVCSANQWSQGDITLQGLQQICAQYIQHGHDAVRFKGLSKDRATVFLGGICILRALFEQLNIHSMQVSQQALREGVLYDLIGRLRHDDVRHRSVISLAQRFQVNTQQAEQLADTSRHLLTALAEPWQLDRSQSADLLCWAAYLNTLGLCLSHTKYHRHSAYIVEHADLSGFSRQEQTLLAWLVLAHRKRFPEKQLHSLGGSQAQQIKRIGIVNRIAWALHRGRNEQGIREHVALCPVDQGACLHINAQWLEAHPLTQAALVRESNYLAEIGFRLSVHPVNESLASEYSC